MWLLYSRAFSFHNECFCLALYYIPATMLLLGLHASMQNRGVSNVKIIKWYWLVPQISVRVSFHAGRIHFCSKILTLNLWICCQCLHIPTNVSCFSPFDRLQDTLVWLGRSHKAGRLWDPPPAADATPQWDLLPACGHRSHDSVWCPCSQDRWRLSSVSCRTDSDTTKYWWIKKNWCHSVSAHKKQCNYM